jgi:hypothetical protein
MKKKIFAISCIMLFLLCVIPTCNSQEIVKDTALNTMTIAHVVIKGDSTEFFIGYHFIAGIGRCSAMIVNLETNGYVEINKLFDKSDPTVLDGSRVVILIGFIGYLKMVENGMELNGVALIAVW